MQSPQFSPGESYYGFTLDRLVPLPHLRATALQFSHPQTGAQLLHLATPDNENCLSVSFPTPPPDDTGVPHILEHAVLAGSKRFPVREPFFEMVKMSMATFINAMTSQAYTIYPVSSTVPADFWNLAEVYADAVFHPLLTEDTFKREGHHLTLEDNEDLNSPLKVSGIVFNEMKGAYSAPESVLGQILESALAPDIALGLDSGGDPLAIPNLTFEQLQNFYSKLYHPGNALIFIYGDISTETHLKWWEEKLEGFGRGQSFADAPRQPRFSQPKRVEKTYPVQDGDELKEKTFIVMSWLTGDDREPIHSTSWDVLSRLLVGNDAAPLKKALIDSKLGLNVSFTGASSNEYEGTFSAGIQGSEPDRADALEKLVLETLQKVADTPFEAEHVEAAFQQLAYDSLEVKSLFPLHQAFAANHTWAFGADPLTFLDKGKHLDAVRQKFEGDPLYFNALIRDGLLQNSHRVMVVLAPEPGLQERIDADFAEKMAERRALLSDAEIECIAREARELDEAQGIPNTPEQLASLPQLKIADLPLRPRAIPTEKTEVAGFETLRNDVFCNGVNYLEAAVDLRGLPEELWPALPAYCAAFGKMGVEGEDFATVARRRAAHTGGLWAGQKFVRHAQNEANSPFFLHLGLKTLDGGIAPALQLLGDLIFTLNPHDLGRLEELLTQGIAGLRTSLINSGLTTAQHQAARHLSPQGRLSHLWHSPDALRRGEDLSRHFAAQGEHLAHQIAQIRDFLADRKRWTLSFTGADASFAALEDTLKVWNEKMKADYAPLSIPAPSGTEGGNCREGWAGPMNVAYCAKSFPALPPGDPRMPLVDVGLYAARFDFLLAEIRLKGNAYGAGGGHSGPSGTCDLYSYRDPNITETLAVFDALPAWIAGASWSQADIDRAIIGLAKDAEPPIRPGAATGTALVRHLRGESPELREKHYLARRGATPQSVKVALAEYFQSVENSAAVCVVSSREKLEAANSQLGEKTLELNEILPGGENDPQ